MSSLRLRRRRPCSPSAASPLDVDDLLSEILLLLPPQPSSLPRASAVCKRWRLLVSDPRFLRRFQVHHRRNPPLLGCYIDESFSLDFLPTMEDPNRVPPVLLSLQFNVRSFMFTPLGCRHGLALLYYRREFLVWDPVTGDQHYLAVPPGLDPKTTTPRVRGAALRAAGDVHFEVVVVAISNDPTRVKQRALACVYSSETGLWGDLISTPNPLEHDSGVDPLEILFGTMVSTDSAVLVRDSLYWKLTFSSSILEFDFEKLSLAVIRMPMDMFERQNSFTVIRADGGGLGILSMSNYTAQLWERNTNCDGVASWVLGRTIELDKLLSLDSEVQGNIKILGFAEENNMVFLWTAIGTFMVQLQSLEFKKLPEFNLAVPYYPFESVYTADIGGEHGGGELLRNA